MKLLVQSVICVWLMASLLCTGVLALESDVNNAALSDKDNSCSNVFQRTGLMYLEPEPYKWICLEVDAVEGAEPKDEVIDALVEFLKTHCLKPVVVKRKDVIKCNKVKNLSAHVIATQNMLGPSEDAEKGVPAYIYVLFYNGTKKDDAAEALRLYPCGIIVNMSRIKPDMSWAWPKVLMHEGGHVLGLYRRKMDSDKIVHCKNKKCLMYENVAATWSLSKLLSGKDAFVNKGATELCDECKQGLLEIKKSKIACKMDFKGPFLVRKEDGYFVMTLPSHLHLGLGPVDIDWHEILKLARKLSTEQLSGLADGSFTTTFTQHYSGREEMLVKGRESIKAALKDENKKVVELARGMKKSWEATFGTQIDKHDNNNIR